MSHGSLSLFLALAVSQAPKPAPEQPPVAPLPGLTPGTVVRVTTSRDAVTGTVGDIGSGEFLRIQVAGSAAPTYVRKSAIETIRVVPEAPQAGASAALAAARATRHVVYVHGICSHTAGFSRPWWEAMRPFTSQIDTANVHEVLWSDIVNRTATAAAAAPPALNDEQRRLAEELREILRDRAEQAAPEGGDTPPASGSAAAVHDRGGEMAAAGIFGGLGEAVGCANDFVLYMTVSSIRERILSRFDEVVRPLLEAGAEIEIISHSWGTVIAYEGLRRFESLPSSALTGKVHNLFTVGSALSIGPVKSNLAGRISGGARPRGVDRWVNIDAQFDVVGGHIQGVPFAVDVERLRLPPVDCPFPVTPTCAHGSYFKMGNLQVNRDIFGRYIGQ